MANNTLKTRIILNNKTSEEWASSTYNSFVPLKGEVCIYSDLRKIKIGDGITTVANLTFANLTPEEVQSLISAALHSHSNKSILDATTASFTTALLNKLNGIADGANKTVVDSSLSSTSTNPVQNKVVYTELNNKVPTSRTVNGKALSSNISLTASDVGADASGSASSALASAKSYSDTNLATAKGYTDTKVAALVGTAPETMDTLEELATAIDAHQDITDALKGDIINIITDPDNYPLSKSETNSGPTILAIELGGLSRNDGSETERTDSIRTVDYIPVVAGQNYTLSNSGDCLICILCYDSSKNFLTNWNDSYSYSYKESGSTIKIPKNAAYIRFYCSKSSDTSVEYTIINENESGGSISNHAEFVKQYFKNHGYAIYGNNIDDETMHKLVIKALGMDENTYNITEIKAPEFNPQEATICLMNWGNGKKQFVDFSSMVYDENNPTVELVCQTRGEKKLPEFSIRYNNGNGAGRVKKFVVKPDAIPMEMTADGLVVRRNNNYDNNATSNELVTVNLADLYDNTILLNAAIGNKVDKVSGKDLSTNDYTTAEKDKLSGIAAGAEVNQNAFSKITVGSTTVEADSKTDTLTLVAGSNVTITPDATNDSVTIAAKDTVYTHPTSSGNKHIPSGGSSGQILRWSADGTAAWGADNNTTYSAGTGIFLSGTTFSNSGVRSISTGSANGTISVDTNGTSADVAVKGLGSAAYTNSSAYAISGHTHNYAGSSSAGGAANSVANSMVVKLNGGSTEGTNLFTFNGSAAKTVNITASGIGAAASSHTHTKSQITDFPTSLPASDVYSWAKASTKPSYAWSEITGKPDLLKCMRMYGGTALDSKGTTADSAAQYNTIALSTATANASGFSKVLTDLPKGKYSVMIRMKISANSSSGNIIKVQAGDTNALKTFYVRPNMFTAANTYQTFGFTVDHTTTSFTAKLLIGTALSGVTVNIDYLSIAPAFTAISSVA